MRRRIFAVGILLLAGIRAVDAGTYTGTVFMDANGNGTRDEGEKGVAGCVISDERVLARTGDDGRYRLDLPAGPAALFVVNPSGTWPAGRWWAPIDDGNAGGMHDFALRPQEQDGPVTFVQGTDIHLRPDAVGKYASYIEHVNALPVPIRFVVHTGDLIIDGNPLPVALARPLFDQYLKASAGLKAPLRNLPGNHEVVGSSLPASLGAGRGTGKETYRECVGPATYAFRYGPYHFLALDGTAVQDRKPVFSLAPESEAWAEAYLAGVPAGESVVILIHEPLGTGPVEQRLQAALSGKRLVATLCGHGHGRSAGTWGGAPQIMGGAVSYAWHGLMPFPPQPHGYVLYRLEGDRIEYVYLDWAEERSFDVAQPAFTGIASGKQAIRGTINDFDGSITAVSATLAGRHAAMALARRGSLAQEFSGEIDLAGLADGVYDLELAARAGAREWHERQPVIVANGISSPVKDAAPAALLFRAEGMTGPGNEVLCNGEPLGLVPPDAKATQDVRIPVPAERLRRLNAFTFRCALRDGGPDRLVIRSLRLEVGEAQFRDVRAPWRAEARPRPPAKGKAPELTAYFDVTYEGSRAAAP